MAKNLVSEINQLRSQGLTDNIISDELINRGYPPEQVNLALSQADDGGNSFGGMTGGGMAEEGMVRGGIAGGRMAYPAQSAYGSEPAAASLGGIDSTLLDRIEEVAENIIDEKWDELIAEVKKIVEWKEKIEEKQAKMENDLDQLKEDFKLLHQGVLGKLEEYDTRMQDVGTELKAVGKVFKDVVPQFIDNVKELSSVTGKLKK